LKFKDKCQNNNYPKQEQRLNLDMGINNMSQMNSISPKAIKPAKNFVQKNYNKYTNTGNISEDEAFDWN